LNLCVADDLKARASIFCQKNIRKLSLDTSDLDYRNLTSDLDCMEPGSQCMRPSLPSWCSLEGRWANMLTADMRHCTCLSFLGNVAVRLYRPVISYWSTAHWAWITQSETG